MGHLTLDRMPQLSPGNRHQERASQAHERTPEFLCSFFIGHVICIGCSAEDLSYFSNEKQMPAIALVHSRVISQINDLNPGLSSLSSLFPFFQEMLTSSWSPAPLTSQLTLSWKRGCMLLCKDVWYLLQGNVVSSFVDRYIHRERERERITMMPDLFK